MSKSLETKLRELPGTSVGSKWHVELEALVAFLKQEAEAKEPEAPAVPRKVDGSK